jgi:hypothetical protein
MSLNDPADGICCNCGRKHDGYCDDANLLGKRPVELTAEEDGNKHSRPLNSARMVTK